MIGHRLLRVGQWRLGMLIFSVLSLGMLSLSVLSFSMFALSVFAIRVLRMLVVMGGVAGDHRFGPLLRQAHCKAYGVKHQHNQDRCEHRAAACRRMVFDVR
ncbi:hypothetical protein Mal64_08560 [Pseudobythopirellula maris]|uniref:Uncharacterized protein n=1 Tax=Pseudobythopirellula maris TaxID=2527991 RepID=A0A5C5ZTS4_9BACT|nr:hypothetical protein [Pseudobythopirellula maris]TWT90467.1 hypothetical protein Mal64_08560 [Pseudobythopirellula maris]